MKRLRQAITFILIFPWLCVIAIMPYQLAYMVSDLSFYLVYYILKYRRAVVGKNLRNAFPTKTEDELKQITKAFYKQLCDLLIEYVKTLIINPSQITHRCIIENPELLQNLYAANKHVLLLAGHCGNWEWAANAVAIETKYKVQLVYKPLSNPYFDSLISYIRKRFNKTLIKEKQVLRKMLSSGSRLTATAILADQAPSHKQVYVMDFLNQTTYMAQGVEKLAKKLNYPIVYVHVRKIKRGHYGIRLEMLCESPRGVASEIISRIYMEKLEKDIQAQPAIWLWSHKRWK